MTERVTEIYSLLVPLLDARLIIPRSCVAEVIGFQDLSPDDLSAADEQIAQELDRGRGRSHEAEDLTVSLAGIDAARAAEVRAAIDAGAQD